MIKRAIKMRAGAVYLGDYADLTPANVPSMCIRTGSSRPICQKARPIPVAAKEFSEAEVAKLVEAGFAVRVFDSSWASPVHIVPKRGAKKWRMVIDY